MLAIRGVRKEETNKIVGNVGMVVVNTVIQNRDHNPFSPDALVPDSCDVEVMAVRVDLQGGKSRGREVQVKSPG